MTNLNEPVGSAEIVIPLMQTFEPAAETLKHHSPIFRWCIRIVIIACLLYIFYASLTGGVFEPIYHAISHAHWSLMVVRPSLLWIFMGVVLLTFRTILWFLYRPFPAFAQQIFSNNRDQNSKER